MATLTEADAKQVLRGLQNLNERLRSCPIGAFYLVRSNAMFFQQRQ